MEEENNIKIIEGKEYVPIDVAKTIKSQKIREIIILILIVFVIILLILAILSLVKNAKIINRDALIIGMESHDFQSCQCIDSDGLEWDSEGGGFLSKPIQGSSKNTLVNFSNINIPN